MSGPRLCNLWNISAGLQNLNTMGVQIWTLQFYKELFIATRTWQFPAKRSMSLPFILVRTSTLSSRSKEEMHGKALPVYQICQPEHTTDLSDVWDSKKAEPVLLKCFHPSWGIKCLKCPRSNGKHICSIRIIATMKICVGQWKYCITLVLCKEML